MPALHYVTDLASLQQSLWLRQDSRVAIALPSLTTVQQENLEHRFNRSLADSSSQFCWLSVVAILVGCILFDTARWSFFTVHPVTMLTGNLAACLLAALAGKILGSFYARWQLARLIWAVSERLEDIEENASPRPYPSAQRGGLFSLRSRSSRTFPQTSF